MNTLMKAVCTGFYALGGVWVDAWVPKGGWTFGLTLAMFVVWAFSPIRIAEDDFLKPAESTPENRARRLRSTRPMWVKKLTCRCLGHTGLSMLWSLVSRGPSNTELFENARCERCGELRWGP